ncbi:MAG TPA: hypothetical protein VEN79_09345 [Terriglobia bacterium]|nr:hypothetical protein [Terriglobia bacterium]
MMDKLVRPFLVVLLSLLPAGAQTTPQTTFSYSSGLPGTITDAKVQPVGTLTPLPPGYKSPDADPTLMAAWGLRHLIHNPRPPLNYEPVFFIRPMHVPPTLAGHDPIVPGDTDCRMDWEFIYMRDITRSDAGRDVEKGLRQRILGYVGPDYLAWQTPGARMEGDVYKGAVVPEEKEAWPWSTSKIIRSLSETYVRTGDPDARDLAGKMFVALRQLATWDSGRAYFAGSAWRDGKWIVKDGAPTAALEPIVRYWEATGNPEALQFSTDLAEGMIASPELIPKGTFILPSGEFHGHMHGTLHAVWGVAHLGEVRGNMRYVEWSKRVYDYASQFGTGTGWMSAALWSEPVRELSETCATSDMVSIASCIAQAGFPDYWDHVERTFRNYLRPLQFFVTPRYEALYRELNRDQPEAEIRAGLARMTDLQGAMWGGPGPNDCINWIASPPQCGPYNTPYGCAGMFGCCVGEGMRALYTVWSSIVTASSQGVFVNLSLNRDSQWAQVISSLPDRGRIDVTARQTGDYFLRPPAWAPRAQVRVARGGKESVVDWGGPALAYVHVKNVEPGEVITLVYPLVTWRQVVAIWPTLPDLKLTIWWKGNAVMIMEPKGKGLPVDFANLAPVPPLPNE